MDVKGVGAYLWVKRYNESWIHSASIPVTNFTAKFSPGKAEELAVEVPAGKVVGERRSGSMSISKFIDQYDNRFPFASPNTRYEVQLKVGDKASASRTRTLFDGVITDVSFNQSTVNIHAKGWMEVLKSIPATFSNEQLMNIWGGDDRYLSVLGYYKGFLQTSEYLRRVVSRVPGDYLPGDTRQAALAFLNKRTANSSYYRGDHRLPITNLYDNYVKVRVIENRNRLLHSQISAEPTSEGEWLQQQINSATGPEDRGLAKLQDVDTEATIFRLITNLTNSFRTSVITSPEGDWYLAPHNGGVHFFSNRVVDISDSDILPTLAGSTNRQGMNFSVRAAVMPNPGGPDIWGNTGDVSGLVHSYGWENGALGRVTSAGPLWPSWLPRDRGVLSTGGRIITAQQLVNSSFEGQGYQLDLDGIHRILPLTLVKIGSKINDIVGNSLGGSSSYYGVTSIVVYRGKKTEDGVSLSTTLLLQPFMNKEVYDELETKTLRSGVPCLNCHLLYGALWTGGEF